MRTFYSPWHGPRARPARIRRHERLVYSHRSESIGSIRAARQAGVSVPAAPAITTMTTPPAHVSQSQLLVELPFGAAARPQAANGGDPATDRPETICRHGPPLE
jgi:hypothetical protein